jgi:hypothetical protein
VTDWHVPAPELSRHRRLRGALSARRPPGAQRLLPAGHDAGAAVGHDGAQLEHAVRLQRPHLVRPRRLLRPRRLHHDHRLREIRHLALARHPAGHGRGRARRHRHRHHHLPAAGSLLRPVDAGLPARHAVRVRVARVPGGDAADDARGAGPLRSVQRPARLCGSRAGPGGGVHGRLAACGAVAFWHVAARHQAERAGRRGRRHRHAELEDARHHAERGHGRRRAPTRRRRSCR